MSVETIEKYKQEYRERVKWLESLGVGSNVFVQCRFPQYAPVTSETPKQVIVTIKYGEADWPIRFWKKTGDQVGGGMRIWPNK